MSRDRTSGSLPTPASTRIWEYCLMQGIHSLCCPVAFCKCFHDYFGSTVSARLFDNCDDVLFTHPFSAVCVIFYAKHIEHGFGVAFRRRTVGFPQSLEELTKILRLVSCNVRGRDVKYHVYLDQVAPVQSKCIRPHSLVVAAAVLLTCPACSLLFDERRSSTNILGLGLEAGGLRPLPAVSPLSSPLPHMRAPFGKRQLRG